jgi:hypothetical protein
MEVHGKMAQQADDLEIPMQLRPPVTKVPYIPADRPVSLLTRHVPLDHRNNRAKDQPARAVMRSIAGH